MHHCHVRQETGIGDLLAPPSEDQIRATLKILTGARLSAPQVHCQLYKRAATGGQALRVLGVHRNVRRLVKPQSECPGAVRQSAQAQIETRRTRRNQLGKLVSSHLFNGARGKRQDNSIGRRPLSAAQLDRTGLDGHNAAIGVNGEAERTRLRRQSIDNGLPSAVQIQHRGRDRHLQLTERGGGVKGGEIGRVSR